MDLEQAPKPPAPTPVIELQVWDPFLRVLHWTLAASVTGAWLLGEPFHLPDHTWHEWLGYLALVTAALRVVWGFVGPRHARFTGFVRGPARTWAYARAVLAHREPRYLGHNPLGGWMVLALLLNVFVTAGSGWLGTTDEYWGVEWVQETHAWAGELFLPLVVLHLAGVLFTSLRHREKLVRAMLNGRKAAPGPGDVD
jgi:cytochrome b